VSDPAATAAAATLVSDPAATARDAIAPTSNYEPEENTPWVPDTDAFTARDAIAPIADHEPEENTRRVPAVGGEVGPLVWRDTYRYNRAGGIRSIERSYFETTVNAGHNVRTLFPRIAVVESIDKSFVNPSAAYASTFLADLFSGGSHNETYTTDSRNRILTETRRNEKGELIGEFTNTWDGDRVTRVSWKAAGDAADSERVIEYVYNAAGDRIAERDFNNGVLERDVVTQGAVEVETLYMDGQPVLRATWRDGKKISEERIRQETERRRRRVQ
jgi:hypothetical protein